MTAAWRVLTGTAPTRQRAMFAGAQVSRLTADWITSPLVSGRRELEELPTLRARSRQLARDSAIMRRYLTLREENVVGPSGIALQMRTGNAALDRAVEAWWKSFAASTDLDPTGQRDVHEMAREADRLRAMDGEAFFRWRAGRGVYGRVLQSIDPDQVPMDENRQPEQGRPEIRHGVEIDSVGRPLAYHIYPFHPDEPASRDRREAVRVMAGDVIHVWHRTRPGQTRGLPDVYAVLMTLKMLDGYEEAALVAARAGAHKLGFITQKDGTPPADLDGAPAPSLPNESEPGQWQMLDPGYSVETYDPAFPNIQHDQFTKAFRRTIAVGLGVSYDALFGDLEAVNFSSGRLGRQSMQDRWRLEQHRIVRTFYVPVFRMMLEAALAMGAIPGVRSGRLDELVAAASWRPRGWAPVDPTKEEAARSARLAMGMTTFADEAAADGRDWDENIERLALEYRAAEAAGVPLLAALPAQPPAEPASQEDPNAAV